MVTAKGLIRNGVKEGSLLEFVLFDDARFVHSITSKL